MRRFLFLLVVLVLAGGAIFFLFFRPRGPEGGGETPPPAGTLPPVSGTVPREEGGGEAPPSLPQKLSRAIQNEVAAYFVDPQGNLSIIQPDGRVIRSEAGKETTTLSGTPIADISLASFSHDGTRALVSFGGAGSRQWTMFDLARKAWVPLPSEVKSAVWSPKDVRFLAVSERSGKTTLSLYDAKKLDAKPSAMLSLYGQDLAARWPTTNTLFLNQKPSAFSSGSLLLFDVAKKILTPILSDRPGLLTEWNASATQALAFEAGTAARGGNLSLISQNGSVLRKFSFLTLPSKCAFHTKTFPESTAESVPVIYCAIPRDQEKFRVSMLPDAYLKRALSFEDDFYEISLIDGSVTPLLEKSALSFDAEDLRVSAKKLYFVNRFDKKLYALSVE